MSLLCILYKLIRDSLSLIDFCNYNFTYLYIELHKKQILKNKYFQLYLSNYNNKKYCNQIFKGYKFKLGDKKE